MFSTLLATPSRWDFVLVQSLLNAKVFKYPWKGNNEANLIYVIKLSKSRNDGFSMSLG